MNEKKEFTKWNGVIGAVSIIIIVVSVAWMAAHAALDISHSKICKAHGYDRADVTFLTFRTTCVQDPKRTIPLADLFMEGQ